MLVDELLLEYYVKSLVEQFDTIKMVCDSLISIPEDSVILPGNLVPGNKYITAGIFIIICVINY